MSVMYCPQCGRELDLDSGEVRFCRYCGFSLVDTKEALHGYSEQKRTGFSIVSWSYVVLLMTALLLHGRFFPLDTRWGYWLSAILIVVSVSFFASASLSTLKPAMFSKTKRGGQGAIATHEDDRSVLRSAENHVPSLPASRGVPVAGFSAQGKRTAEFAQPASVTEATTQKLDE